MRDLLEEALQGHQAEYVEIHGEQSQASHIVFRGGELEDLGRGFSAGGNVRALVKGGWGFVTFNDWSDLRGKVTLAVAQARLVGQEATPLAEVPPVVSIVPATVGKNPLQVPLAQKVQLLQEYNDLILSTPGIQSSSIFYSEGQRKLYFASSQGSYIEQERLDATTRLGAIARRNGDVQQAGMSLGALGDYAFLEGLHDQVKEIAARAVALTQAPNAKAGEYTVVLDPVLAGVFCHEAFGHLSEADFLYENERMQEIMVLGRRFGGPHLNIVDGAAIPGLRGSYQYDDEGTPATKTYLIREGVLMGRLHSRETAGKMGEAPTGNARAINYRHRPIVRMTNTYIEPGSVSFQDMIADVKEGIYAKNWYGGTTTMEMFTFSAGEAYMIRHGRVEELLRGVVLTGNVFTTLEQIDAIGDDLAFNQGGGCGKGGQAPLPVATGSPHIRIRKCVVGGR